MSSDDGHDRVIERLHEQGWILAAERPGMYKRYTRAPGDDVSRSVIVPVNPDAADYEDLLSAARLVAGMTTDDGRSTVGTDARERLAEVIRLRVAANERKPLGTDPTDDILDALLSEGCRGDLAEAAGFQSYAQNLKMGCEMGYRRGRRETALKIADAIEAVNGDWVQRRRDAAIARSFTEEGSAPPAVVGEGPDGPIVRLTPGQAAMIKRQTWTWESSDE